MCDNFSLLFASEYENYSVPPLVIEYFSLGFSSFYRMDMDDWRATSSGKQKQKKLLQVSS